MRLDILNRGYGPGTKLLFALIRLFSGHPVPDAAKLVFYRPGFYGAQAKTFTHEQQVSAIVVSYYWHFVDVVWIGLFTTIYLIH